MPRSARSCTMSVRVIAALLVGSKQCVEPSWPIVVAQASPDQGVSPIRPGKRETLLEPVPVARRADHERSLDSFGILTSSRSSDRTISALPSGKWLLIQRVSRGLISMAMILAHGD